MTEIKSDVSLASQRANALADAISGLSSGAVTLDENTTVVGNATAKSLIANQSTVCQTLESQLTNMVANIHSLASEFEVTDTGLSQSIQGISKW